MRDPLNKRLPRELKSDIGKHLVIFLFFVLIIGAVSGFLVADNSLIKSYDESFEKFNIEDGNFELYTTVDEDTMSAIEKDGGIKTYENYYKDEETKDFSSTLRIFGERTEIDLVDIWEGDLPSADNEIAIDRLYAKNHDLKVGDTISAAGIEFTISGIVALSDYSTLYEKPSDLMFDNDKFGVGVTTAEGFEAVRDNHIHYSYSWLYNKKPKDDEEAKEKAEDLIKVLSENAVITNYIPAYANQAIIFAGNDMGGDKMSMIVFLYLTVIILAFIVAITTDSTINKEASVIGTLRASGYTRRELIRHYMIMPVLTLLAGAVVGNILGYTLLESYMADAYLGSYSLPTYDILINPEAFVMTTAAPFVIMVIINYVSLSSKLKLSPLRFIRRDISKRKKKKAFRLNTKINIMARFRLRIIFQNLPNYITIIVGVLLANIILFFGIAFKPLLLNFQESIEDNMLAKNIYVLKMPAETETSGAEKGAMLSLSTIEGKAKAEDVSIYGVETDSKYVRLTDHSKVYISTAYRDKYDIEEGDSITLKEEYGSKEYDFTVGGFYDYPSTIAVFMDLDSFNETFELDKDNYNIYFSNNEIEDIDDSLIAAKINKDDLTKTSRQLIRSMGGMMKVFEVFGIIMFVLIIYLLAKIIVEKNAQSISMTKILGYTDREINGLYVHTTTIVTVLSLICTIPLVDFILSKIFKIVFLDYSGYLEYDVSPLILIRTGLMGLAAYICVAVLLNMKVKKIPLAEALKNVE